MYLSRLFWNDNARINNFLSVAEKEDVCMFAITLTSETLGTSSLFIGTDKFGIPHVLQVAQTSAEVNGVMLETDCSLKAWLTFNVILGR